ncbi:protein LURP-one-related 5-like [Durio zibethinus]|uniref:Protein LURP-one-related 5-like n=1 Tax=Durio zibethinus TaxID=66656 RepID=A0A6P5ZMX1_DURZI|nr:protein LURP-one-related 5-like [Durio zibethinus]
MATVAIVGDKFCFHEETHLTVHKTSVFFPGDGFVIDNPKGELIFRFDSYNGPDSQPKDELVLMDATGKCLLTLIRKKPSLDQLLGVQMENESQIFFVRRSSIIGRSSVEVDVYGVEYQMGGSFPQRCCTVNSTSLESSSKKPTAEIKKKVDPSTHVMLGKDVFLLCLKHSAFAMGLVLILDQMYDDGDMTTMMIMRMLVLVREENVNIRKVEWNLNISIKSLSHCLLNKKLNCIIEILPFDSSYLSKGFFDSLTNMKFVDFDTDVSERYFPWYKILLALHDC